MTLEQLRAKLEALKTQMQALIDEGFTEENGNEQKFDALESEAKSVRSTIEKVARFEQSTAEDDTQGLGRKTQAQKPSSIKVRDNKQDDPTAGFKGLGEFALAVMGAVKGDIDERLKVMGAPSNFHRETGASDGYMVPTEYKDKLFEIMFGEPDLLSMVDSEPTSSNSVQFLADETTPWGSTGIQAYWGAEGNQFTPSRLDTDGREVKLNKLHAFITATDELIEDAPRLDQRITSGAARAMNWKGNEAILFGTGAGQPLGFDAAASKVSVAKESGQAADTVVANNVAKMYSRNLNPARSVWLMNQDVIPQIMTMTIGDQPIWTPPSSGFTQAPGGFLMGRPIMFSDQCGTVGDNTDIMFVDPMGYYLARKTSGIKFNSSIHLYFDYDIQAFKWTFRLGGLPYLSEAVTPNKGSATRSHYVTLAARA